MVGVGHVNKLANMVGSLLTTLKSPQKHSHKLIQSKTGRNNIMSKKRDLRSSKILAIVILIAVAMIACSIGGQATQAPGAQSPEEPQAQVPPEGAAAPIEQDASSQAASSGILFQDDFQDGQPDNWQITSSWYVQQAGDIYNFAAVGRGGAWVPAGYNWSDYAFESDVVLNDGSLILSFDYTNAGRYLLHLREDGLFLVKEQPPHNYTVLAHTGPVPVGQWHRIGVKGKDGRLQVRVDDQLWIDTIDPQPLSKGTISVSTLAGSQASVDNVLVSQLSNPLVAAPAVAPPPIADPQVVEDELEEISSVMPVENIEPIKEGVLAPAQEAPEAGELAPPQEVPSDEAEDPPQVVPVDQGQPRSDLSIVDPDLPSAINQGTPFSVSVTIHNAGPDIAVPYTVLWYPEGLSFIGCSWDIYDHQTAPDNRRTVTCEYPGYPNAGTFTWIVQADPEGAVNDFDPNGNERSGTITVRPK